MADWQPLGIKDLAHAKEVLTALWSYPIDGLAQGDSPLKANILKQLYIIIGFLNNARSRSVDQDEVTRLTTNAKDLYKALGVG